MATPTYTPLANITLSSSASSVTFSSIGQGFRDLICVINVLGASGGGATRWTFNGDTGSNYPFVRMAGNGSTTNSATATRAYFAFDYAEPDTSDRLLITLQALDYSTTDKHKTVLGRAGRSGQGVNAMAGRWASTSAVTSVEINCYSDSFAAGSTFALYGVAA